MDQVPERPKKPRRRQKAIRLAADLYLPLGHLGVENNISFGELVRPCCTFALKELQEPEQPKGLSPV